MRTIRYRVVLPIFFGLVSFALIAWEFHNERVIQSMGMAWDTGPPVWPYQASWILLQGINAPARLMDLPVIAAFGLKSGQQQLALELPTILVWWWFIGWRIDFGLVPTQISLHRIWQVVGLWTISLGLFGFLAYLIADQLHFWSEYGTVTGQLMRLMRSAGLLIWCLLLGTWTAIAGLRCIRKDNDPKSTI
jgi:hypothetical protein